MTEPGENPNGLAEGTLISHLLELRDRLLKAMLAVGICFIPCALYMNQLFTFVAEPLKRKLPAGATLIATSVVAPFTVPFKLALVLAIGIAIPFVLYQAWAFVAPGLYRHEKKLAVPLLVSSVLLFYLGAAFAYYVVFPVMLRVPIEGAVIAPSAQRSAVRLTSGSALVRVLSPVTLPTLNLTPPVVSVISNVWLASCPYTSEAKSDFASVNVQWIFPCASNEAENLAGSPETLIVVVE